MTDNLGNEDDYFKFKDYTRTLDGKPLARDEHCGIVVGTEEPEGVMDITGEDGKNTPSDQSLSLKTRSAFSSEKEHDVVMTAGIKALHRSRLSRRDQIFAELDDALQAIGNARRYMVDLEDD